MTPDQRTAIRALQAHSRDLERMVSMMCLYAAAGWTVADGQLMVRALQYELERHRQELARLRQQLQRKD